MEAPKHFEMKLGFADGKAGNRNGEVAGLRFLQNPWKWSKVPQLPSSPLISGSCQGAYPYCVAIVLCNLCRGQDQGVALDSQKLSPDLYVLQPTQAQPGVTGGWKSVEVTYI